MCSNTAALLFYFLSYIAKQHHSATVFLYLSWEQVLLVRRMGIFSSSCVFFLAEDRELT